MVSSGLLYLGSAHHFVGVLEHSAGKPEEAAAHFESALENNERMGAITGGLPLPPGFKLPF